MIEYDSSYTGGRATHYSNFGSVPHEFSMDNVACDGSEDSLHSCPHLDIDNCGSSEGAGVICSLDIYLEGGSVSNEGNLFVNGRPVCDDIWDDADAMVACRTLGFVDIAKKIMLFQSYDLDLLKAWQHIVLIMEVFQVSLAWTMFVVLDQKPQFCSVTISQVIIVGQLKVQELFVLMSDW